MCAFCILTFVSADPSLGKIDKHSLSQQTLMELSIASFTNREIICLSKEEPANLSRWPSVVFDVADDVMKIHWGQSRLEGTAEFKWLPPTTKYFDLSGNALSGTADLTCLPGGLEHLFLTNNHFEGPIDLTKLPLALQELYLNKNGFSGRTDFSQLPKSLKYVNVSNTQLFGEILEFEGKFPVWNSYVKDMRKK